MSIFTNIITKLAESIRERKVDWALIALLVINIVAAVGNAVYKF